MGDSVRATRSGTNLMAGRPHDHEEHEGVDEIDADLLDAAADAEDHWFCPSCGAAVWEDATRCNHCGDWITPVESRRTRWATVWFIAAVVLVIGFLLYLIP